MKYDQKTIMIAYASSAAAFLVFLFGDEVVQKTADDETCTRDVDVLQLKPWAWPVSALSVSGSCYSIYRVYREAQRYNKAQSECREERE